MGRSNEFKAGHTPTIIGYHVTSNTNRESIQDQGLKTSWVGDDRRAKETKGVFFSTDKEYLDDFGGENSDIWQVQVPLADVEEDSHVEHAFYSKKDISSDMIQRVGHIVKAPVSTNKFDPYFDIHWHKEEDCPNA